MPFNELITMILGAVLLGAGVLLRGYLSEKGKNLATQEDIGNITHKIEGIRGEIQSIRDSQSRVRTTRQEALLAFSEPCLELFVELLPINPGDFPMDGGKSLFDHHTAMLQACRKIQTAYFRLELLLPKNHPLILPASKVALAAPDLAKAICNNYSKVKQTLIEEEIYWKQGRHKHDPELKKAVDATNAAAKQFHEAVKEPGQIMGLEFGKFRDEVQKYVLSAEARGEEVSVGV